MSITFGEARLQVAQYCGKGGKCADDPDVALFLKQVLDYMLISDAHGNLRKFEFQAVNGVFTLPYELETPLKIRVDGEVGTVWDRWFSFYNQNDFIESECLKSNSFFEEPNLSPVVFDLPSGGAHVAVSSVCKEDDAAFLIVKGTDLSGREIFTQHNGTQVSGEYLSIKKGEFRYTETKFGKITQVLKSKTNGYAQLYWFNAETNARGFLSDYSPLEEKPGYRRVKITSRCSELCKVSVLGRIRLKENYAETDEIPFSNSYALVLAAQAINANYNKDVSLAQAKDAQMQDLNARENSYKNINNGKPIECFFPLSGGSIKGIVGDFGRRRRRW